MTTRNLSAVLLLLSLFITYRSLSQQAPPFWNEVQQLVLEDVQRPRPRGEILFIGSSSFTFWKDVDTAFPEKKIVNVGFGGSTLLDQIRYVDYIVTPYRPKQVVIYCGENDFAYDSTVTAVLVLNRLKELVGLIRSRFPTVYITYVSMKPSPSRANLLSNYQEGNHMISAYLKTIRNSSFINVYDGMLDPSGKPREELFLDDRLHMNEKGYQLWTSIMARYLQ
ncbi:MAG: GDSL-type esterase/lipase family protein [Cyclobacteriaceae bacterium]|jgi:lysophospholipase L1-like esterase|nr:GDSL-type esterase/lipase family protein [Cyclobacteriaceae bacterium]